MKCEELLTLLLVLFLPPGVTFPKKGLRDCLNNAVGRDRSSGRSGLGDVECGKKRVITFDVQPAGRLGEPSLPFVRQPLTALIGKYPLIRPPADQTITRLFAKGMTSHGLHWPTGIEIGTLDLVLSYTARGFGIGVGVCAPNVTLPEGVTAYELKGFPALKVAALWRGKISPLAAEVLKRLKGMSGK